MIHIKTDNEEWFYDDSVARAAGNSSGFHRNDDCALVERSVASLMGHPITFTAEQPDPVCVCGKTSEGTCPRCGQDVDCLTDDQIINGIPGAEKPRGIIYARSKEQ